MTAQTGIETAAPRRFFLRGSPLARKIITFNLIALNVLVAGILYLNSSRDSLALQRANALMSQAELIADVIEIGGADFRASLKELDLRDGIEVMIFDADQHLHARVAAPPAVLPEGGATHLTDALGWILNAVSMPFTSDPPVRMAIEDQLRQMIPSALNNGTRSRSGADIEGGTHFSVVTPINQNGRATGVVAVTSAAGEIDRLVKGERERVLQMFVIATLVSIGLSVVLASTIANPLAVLSAAAELGADKDMRRLMPGRIRIPDLNGRPDEIGRLSVAMRGMVTALYSRIDNNEQFAADVSHEIKNPLASLRSAVGTLRRVDREDQREKLLDVIDHDVRRLDRLVSDISNASRLDSELVKEEEESFDLLEMLDKLAQFLKVDAADKGIVFVTDLPDGPVRINGLEARLAQVFVNLISNAISFCEDGDAIRMWARRREDRFLIVIEDTGPGIPEEALSMVFKRFYSQRPEEHFGNNSGLGLAISKQIVEAHGGVIWAENVRPADPDITSDPLGARFVVGLPL